MPVECLKADDRVFSNACCGENGTEIDRDMVELGIGNDQSTQKTEER